MIPEEAERIDMELLFARGILRPARGPAPFTWSWDCRKCKAFGMERDRMSARDAYRAHDSEFHAAAATPAASTSE